jgi:hypothetical protein
MRFRAVAAIKLRVLTVQLERFEVPEAAQVAQGTVVEAVTPGVKVDQEWKGTLICQQTRLSDSKPKNMRGTQGQRM